MAATNVAITRISFCVIILQQSGLRRSHSASPAPGRTGRTRKGKWVHAFALLTTPANETGHANQSSCYLGAVHYLVASQPVHNFRLLGTRANLQCCRGMSAIAQIIEQRNIAALQKAISRTVSETYEVETALDEWMLDLLQQLEEDEERKDRAA
jgi:hypothetical protein